MNAMCDHGMLLKHYRDVVLLRGLSQLLAFAYVVAVSIVIPADEYGRYSFILSIVLVVGSALLSWPNQALLRYGRDEILNYGSLGKTVGARLILHAVILSAILPLLVYISPYLAKIMDVPREGLALKLGLVMLMISTMDLSNVIAQTTSHFICYGLSAIIQRIVQLAALCLIAFGFSASWEILLWGNVISCFAATALVIALLPISQIMPTRPSMHEVSRILSYSWIMPLTILSAFALSNMGLWYLRSIMTMSDVGVYAWAFNISLLATNMLVPLSAVLAPHTIKIRLSESNDDLLTFMRTSSSAIILASCLMPLVMATLYTVFPYLPLKTYKEALNPMLIFFVCILFQFGMALMEPVMFAHEKLVIRTGLLIFSMAVIAAILNPLLIPLMGLSGAALSMTIAYGYGAAVEWMIFAQYLNIKGNYYPILTCLFTLAPISVIPVLLYAPQTIGIVLSTSICLIMLTIARKLGLLLGLGLIQTRLPASLVPPFIKLIGDNNNRTL